MQSFIIGDKRQSQHNLRRRRVTIKLELAIQWELAATHFQRQIKHVQSHTGAAAVEHAHTETNGGQRIQLCIAEFRSAG